VRAAAMANLAAWSGEAPWVEEMNGLRRVRLVDSGEGWTPPGSCYPKSGRSWPRTSVGSGES